MQKTPSQDHQSFSTPNGDRLDMYGSRAYTPSFLNLNGSPFTTGELIRYNLKASCIHQNKTASILLPAVVD